MFTPGRSERFDHANDVIEHIEAHNCILGCRVPSRKAVEDYGPGGDCPFLARVYLEEPMPEFNDDGNILFCTERIPL